jgi:4-hydroxy-2-oxoglutarate aldolase
MGEAPHLSRDERQTLIRAAREALDEANLTQVPIIAGCSVASTRESILIAKEAAVAGADFAIALTPGFYAGSLMADERAIRNYFVDIADASPIPV